MITHSNMKCTKCTGIDSCNKYCECKVGENLVNFINNIDSIETSIGDFRKDSTGKSTYVVSGYAVEHGDMLHPIDILVSFHDLQMRASGKFKEFMGKTPGQCLMAYTEQQNLSKPIQLKALDDFKLFNSNKILPAPFRPGADVGVTYKGFEGKLKTHTTSVKQMRWNINKETLNLEGFFIADVGRNESGSTHEKFNFRDYGITWTLPNLERNLKTADIRYEAVKMDDIGFIKPLELISSDDTAIAVDCRHMYFCSKGIDLIIGSWIGREMVENEEYSALVKNNKAYKKVKHYLMFLERHKRFIVPYGLVEANTIKV